MPSEVSWSCTEIAAKRPRLQLRQRDEIPRRPATDRHLIVAAGYCRGDGGARSTGDAGVKPDVIEGAAIRRPHDVADRSRHEVGQVGHAGEVAHPHREELGAGLVRAPGEQPMIGGMGGGAEAEERSCRRRARRRRAWSRRVPPARGSRQISRMLAAFAIAGEIGDTARPPPARSASSSLIRPLISANSASCSGTVGASDGLRIGVLALRDGRGSPDRAGWARASPPASSHPAARRTRRSARRRGASLVDPVVPARCGGVGTASGGDDGEAADCAPRDMAILVSLQESPTRFGSLFFPVEGGKGALGAALLGWRDIVPPSIGGVIRRRT